MLLTKLLKVPVTLFKKDVISFLVIHRHDLGVVDDNLRYVAVKPTASISVLRQKVWHLLDLPDFCEEVIILKSDDGEIPLTELRKGNDPRHPFVLEVWLPGNMQCLGYTASTKAHNMITMGNEGSVSERTTTDLCEQTVHQDNFDKDTARTMSAASMAMKKLRDKYPQNTFMQSDYKKPDLSCKISSSSLFFKLQRRNSRDNFTNILLKIQNDLSVLSNKLSTLESKIPT